MAYCVFTNINELRANTTASSRIIDDLVLIDSPREIVAIVAADGYRTCARISARCKFIYAENVDIDIRVPPRKLICRNAIVRLPTLYAGTLISLKNCIVECNSAIATKSTIIKDSRITGIIATTSLTYSNIRNNIYNGYFMFNHLPRKYNFKAAAYNNLQFLTIKDSKLTGHISLDELPLLKYINIARSGFSTIDSARYCRYLCIRYCNIALGSYPHLKLLDAKYATYTNPGGYISDSAIIFEENHIHQPEYLYKYSVLHDILKQNFNDTVQQDVDKYNGDEVADDKSRKLFKTVQYNPD